MVEQTCRIQKPNEIRMKTMKPVTKKIVIGIVILIAVILIFRAIKKRNSTEEELPVSGGSIPITPISGGSGTPSINGNTKFYAQTPYPKNDYVGYIQSLYNKYTAERKTAGKTPDYPKITVDKVFGPQTANAVYRYMGQYHTSWNDFQTRINYYRSKL
jgi:hypothetical protein